MTNDKKETDIYRDTLVRYLGYANEVGEAFRALISRNVVRASYAISVGYVLADTSDKGLKKYHENATIPQIAITAIDVLLWQMFASVIIPGYTINRVAHLSRYILTANGIQGKTLNYSPTIISLLAIPVIVDPIDAFVEYAMDNTYRKVTNTKH